MNPCGRVCCVTDDGSGRVGGCVAASGMRLSRISAAATMNSVWMSTRGIGSVWPSPNSHSHGSLPERQPVREIAAELVQLSRAGLQARVDAGIEKKEALTYLWPLDEILATGTTFADRCLDRWDNEFGRSPQRFAEAFQVYEAGLSS